MDHRTQDHLCSGDDERLPVTLFIFFNHKYFTPPPSFLCLHNFTPLGENRVEQFDRLTFDKGELIVQKRILLNTNLGVKEMCKIRIVPLFLLLFPFYTLKTHKKSAANRRHWESGWRPAHGLSHWMDKLHLSI